VIVPPVYMRQVVFRRSVAPGGPQAAEASADDDDVMPFGHGVCGKLRRVSR
jgi:hypothetical protein